MDVLLRTKWFICHLHSKTTNQKRLHFYSCSIKKRIKKQSNQVILIEENFHTISKTHRLTRVPYLILFSAMNSLSPLKKWARCQDPAHGGIPLDLFHCLHRIRCIAPLPHPNVLSPLFRISSNPPSFLNTQNICWKPPFHPPPTVSTCSDIVVVESQIAHWLNVHQSKSKAHNYPLLGNRSILVHLAEHWSPETL